MITPLVNEDIWLPTLAMFPTWAMPRLQTMIVAPHPDDETLGAGGMIARLRSKGIAVTVVAVTDGENAYPDAPQLGVEREREQTAALARLGVGPDHICRLRLPDSGVTKCQEQLIEALLGLVTAGTHLVAPWSQDYHPDHEACGRAASVVAKVKQIALSSYFFWTWHRGTPADLDGLKLARLLLTEKERQLKQDALSCHRSQLHHASGHPILPTKLLAPTAWPYEVYSLS